MKAGTFAAVLLLGAAVATAVENVSTSVAGSNSMPEYHAEVASDATAVFEIENNFVSEFLLERTYSTAGSSVSACLTASNAFEATCSREIDNVIVVCEEGTAWKFSHVSGTFFKCSVRHCTISYVCVKCGRNWDTRCPSHWGCGQCIGSPPPMCETPTPTPTLTPTPTPTLPPECNDFDIHTCLSYVNSGYCRYSSVRNKCPLSCGVCTPVPTPSPSPIQTPTPTPTPTPSPTPSPVPPTPSPLPTPCPGQDTDVCIVADMTTSEGETGWEVTTQFFIRKVVRFVGRVFPDAEVRYRGIIVGKKVYDILDFTPKANKVLKFFSGLLYIPGDPVIGTAVDKAVKLCNFSSSTTDKILLLITDGNINDKFGRKESFYLLKRQTEKLKAAGVSVFTIGIGDDGNESKLKKISGSSSSSNLYHRIEKYKTDKSFRNYVEKFISC